MLGAAAARGAVRPLNTYRNNTQSNTGTGTGTGTGSGGNLPFSPSPLGPSPQQQHSPQGRTRRRQRQQRSPATGRVRSVGKRDPYTGRVNVPPSSGAGERSTLYSRILITITFSVSDSQLTMNVSTLLSYTAIHTVTHTVANCGNCRGTIHRPPLSFLFFLLHRQPGEGEGEGEGTGRCRGRLRGIPRGRRRRQWRRQRPW